MSAATRTWPWAGAMLGTLAALVGCSQAPLAAPGALAGPLEAASRHAGHKAAIAVLNFAKVDANLYRGGQPTDADLAALQSTYGVKTDIDLQDPDSKTEGPVVAHEQQTAAKLGLNFVSLPLPWGVAPPEAMLQQFFATTDHQALLPAYIHCHFGRDRTGTMVAVYQMSYHGYTNQAALAQMETFGYNPAQFPWYTSFVQGYKATPHPAPAL